MVTKLWSSAYRLVLSLIVLSCTSSSKAQSTWRMETFTVVGAYPSPSSSPSPQPEVARICLPGYLNPAIDCGCLAYSSFYFDNPEWQGLEELCLDELGNDIESGYASCSSTSFTNAGQFSFDVMNRFFHDARENCVYPGTEYAAGVERFIAEAAVRNGGEEAEIVGLGEYSHDSPLTRIPFKAIHKMLGNFCLVLASKRGVSRAQAYRKCSPRVHGEAVTGRPTPSPSPSPSPSPEYHMCQLGILEPASRCGCSGYSPYYLNNPTFRNLTQLCRDELDNFKQSGVASCPSNFTKSDESEEFDYAVMIQYFHVARESCAYPGTAPSSPGSPENRISRRSLRRILCDFCMVLGFLRKFSREKSYSFCCSIV